MISSRSEKELFGGYERDRVDALEDAASFTDAELADLEVTRTQGGGVNNPDTYLIDSSPVDSESDARVDQTDIRNIPGHD